MKKKWIIMLCAVLLLSGCASTEKNSKETAVSSQQIQEEESVTTSSPQTETEANTEQTGGLADGEEMVEIPFGYQLDSGYKEYFTLMMPAATTFYGGTSDGGNSSVEGGKDCREFALEAKDAHLDYAAFSDDTYFNGTVNLVIYNMGQEFAAFSEAWLESGKSTLSSYEISTNEGEQEGYQWVEIFGAGQDGIFQYNVLMELDDKMAVAFSIYGGKEGQVHDMSTAHSYFFEAFIRSR